MSIKDNIRDNIIAEARNQVVNGIPMPVRQGEWIEFAAKALADATLAQQLNPESPDSTKRKGMTREQRLEANIRKLAAKQGISYEQWLKTAKALYKIDDNYTVTSVARGPDFEREWACSSKIEAEERIYKLLTYKHHDHFVRGNDFAYVPEFT